MAAATELQKQSWVKPNLSKCNRDTIAGGWESKTIKTFSIFAPSLASASVHLGKVFLFFIFYFLFFGVRSTHDNKSQKHRTSFATSLHLLLVKGQKSISVYLVERKKMAFINGHSILV